MNLQYPYGLYMAIISTKSPCLLSKRNMFVLLKFVERFFYYRKINSFLLMLDVCLLSVGWYTIQVRIILRDLSTALIKSDQCDNWMPK